MSVVELACASMAAEAWVNTLYLAILVLSSAISTSTIRPSAAFILLFIWEIISSEYESLDMVPPFSARRDAMFSNALVNTPTEIWFRSIVSSTLADANVNLPDAPTACELSAVENNDALRLPEWIVRADNNDDLDRLTLDPSLPSALVKIVSVLS